MLFLLFVIAYAFIGFVTAACLRDEVSSDGLFWVGLAWPVVVLMFTIIIVWDWVSYRLRSRRK